jgi:GT2 family glycosyltransferase
MDLPRISFIILTLNRRDLLVHALLSVTSQEYPNKEIIVVDNGSTDGTEAFVRGCFPSVKLVVLKENIGAAAARNRGIQASEGKFLLLLDDDCVLASVHAAQAVVSNFLADPGCGAIALRITDPYSWEEGPYNLRRGPEVALIYESTRFCCGGAALRRATLDQVGLFWEPIFLDYEDTDLSLRIVRSGWRIMRRGDLVVFHPRPDPRGFANPRREMYFGVRNALWVVLRNMPLGFLFHFVALTWGRKFLWSVRRGMLPYFIRGVMDSLKGIPARIRERKPLTREQVARAQRMSLKFF